MKTKPGIMISSLNWGLGHASRCVPIIKELQNQNYDVLIAADGAALSFLAQEFPEIKYIELPGLKIKYPKNKLLIPKLLLGIPQNLHQLNQEHQVTKRAVSKFQLKAIISDNRFGVFDKRIYSVFITHQIQILSSIRNRFVENLLYKTNLTLQKNFKEVWIPDFKDFPNLSGKLSHQIKLHPNSHFIGPLSRFSLDSPSIENSQIEIPEVFAMVSGPECQRTLFEEKLLEQLHQTGLNSILIQGLPNNKSMRTEGNIRIYPHLCSEELQRLILLTPKIIARSGYSTIMDLVALDKKAILVPTPGQSEQEYLAQWYQEQQLFPSYNQEDLNISEALKHLDEFKGIAPRSSHNDLLFQQVSKLKKMINS